MDSQQHKHHDTGYKELFSYPEFVQQIMEGFAPPGAIQASGSLHLASVIWPSLLGAGRAGRAGKGGKIRRFAWRSHGTQTLKRTT